MTTEIHEMARDSHLEALKMIDNARRWAEDVAAMEASIDGYTYDKDHDKVVELYHERHKRVAEMELSYFRAVSTVVLGYGAKQVARDGHAGFYFIADSGMHGGIIFHNRNGRDDVPVGTWGIHT